MEPRKSVEIILKKAEEGHYTVFIDDFAIGVVHADVAHPGATLRTIIYNSADVIAASLVDFLSDDEE
jgi:hypothetical protein